MTACVWNDLQMRGNCSAKRSRFFFLKTKKKPPPKKNPHQFNWRFNQSNSEIQFVIANEPSLSSINSLKTVIMVSFIICALFQSALSKIFLWIHSIFSYTRALAHQMQTPWIKAKRTPLALLMPIHLTNNDLIWLVHISDICYVIKTQTADVVLI